MKNGTTTQSLGTSDTRKRTATCNKSVDILQQTCYEQADIRMSLNGWQQHVDGKSVASCQKICFKLIVKSCYPQASAATCFNKL